MLSDFDLYGEFAADDTPMPISRGDLLDLLVSADDGRIAVSARAVCLWAERQVEQRDTTCEVITFTGGLAGVTTALGDLASCWLAGPDMIARLDAPSGIGLWIRVLTAGQCEL